MRAVAAPPPGLRFVVCLGARFERERLTAAWYHVNVRVYHETDGEATLLIRDPGLAVDEFVVNRTTPPIEGGVWETPSSTGESQVCGRRGRNRVERPSAQFPEPPYMALEIFVNTP